MTETITAIYEHCVLRPTTPLDLPEHAKVQVTVVATTSADVQKITRMRVEQALAAAGLLAPKTSPPTDIQPLSEEERIALARRMGATGGTPLSEILIEEREDRI